MEPLGISTLMGQFRRQIRAEAEFHASLKFYKGKGKAVKRYENFRPGSSYLNEDLQAITQQPPETSVSSDAAIAAIKRQGLEPPPTPKLGSLELDTEDEEYDEGGLFDHESNSLSKPSGQRGWARSQSPPSRSSSRTSDSVRSASSSSSGGGGKEKKGPLAFEFDGSSQSWKPHSSKSGASVGVDADKAFKGGSFEQLKSSLRMTPIAKPGESVSQAINRVTQLRAPPRPKPEVR